MKLKLKLFWVILLVFLSAVGAYQTTLADQDSRWEIGAGAVAAHTPHYFGSNHYYQGILPYPVLIYRSERLAAQTVDPDKFGQIFIFNNEDLLLELDFSGRFPVTSADEQSQTPKGSVNDNTQIIQEKNYTRRGMDDLPLAGFVGGKISWSPISYLLIEVPILKGFTIGSGFKNVGYIFSPGFEIRFLGRQRENAINITTIFTHGDKVYNQTYYGVKKEETLDERPAYDAKAGLSTVTYGLTFSWTPRPQIKIIGGYVFHNLNGSVVEDSPLVISPLTRSVGFAFNYTFIESNELVEVW